MWVFCSRCIAVQLCRSLAVWRYVPLYVWQIYPLGCSHPMLFHLPGTMSHSSTQFSCSGRKHNMSPSTTVSNQRRKERERERERERQTDRKKRTENEIHVRGRSRIFSGGSRPSEMWSKLVLVTICQNRSENNIQRSTR